MKNIGFSFVATRWKTSIAVVVFTFLRVSHIVIFKVGCTLYVYSGVTICKQIEGAKEKTFESVAAAKLDCAIEKKRVRSLPFSFLNRSYILIVKIN